MTPNHHPQPRWEAVSEWIKCSERYPFSEDEPVGEDEWPTTYLTFPHYLQLCYFDGAWQRFDNEADAWKLQRGVTHWMPLPPPPTASPRDGA